MEVRPDILKKLLCSVCGEYLSCAPVRIKNDGTVLCGRCSDPEDEPTLRITPYEHLAEMLLFPCANKTHGCTETLYMAEMKEHEEECVYRQYVCPVTQSGQCDWSGARKNILDHCTVQHPDNLLQDPYTIQHEINETNHKTFLLAAFEMLFLIHCKVCITSKNIYHSVRLIGKSALASNYEYVLEVLNKKDKLIRSRDVTPQGCMSLQEDTSVHVDIKTILNFLGNYKDTIFKLRVDRKCVQCTNGLMRFAWPTAGGWCCEDCAPVRRQCEFNSKGCNYTDIDEKVKKHETMYCEFGTWCYICEKHVGYSRERHYASQHANVTHETGVRWRANVDNAIYRIITSDIGKIFYYYALDESQFYLTTWSPLHTEQLSDYWCVLKLTNPVTGHAVRKTMLVYYNEQLDWYLSMDKDEFLMYVGNNDFDIKFELVKNKTI